MTTFFENITTPDIDNLVFEGGGVKGIAYVGVVDVLDERGILAKAKRVGGSSAGGITAMLLGLGYDRKEIAEIMTNMDFTEFQDASKNFWDNILPSEAMFLDVLNLKKMTSEGMKILKAALGKKHGMYKGDVFLEWARAKIAKKLGNPDATFKDLHEAMKFDPTLKDMMFTGTNLSSNSRALVNFNWEETPHVRIADAVRATMSFPGAFEAHPIDLTGNGEIAVFVDGGVLNNFPVDYYDRYAKPEDIKPVVGNIRTVGFRVDNQHEMEFYKWQKVGGPATNIDSAFGYAAALTSATLSDRGKVHDRGMITVQISDCEISTLDFSLDDAKKDMLKDAGRGAAESYFDAYRAEGTVLDVNKYANVAAFLKEKREQGVSGITAIEKARKNLSLELEKMNKFVRDFESGELLRGKALNKFQKNELEVRFNLYKNKEIPQAKSDLEEIETALENIQKPAPLELIESVDKLLNLKVQLGAEAQKTLEEIYQDAVKLREELKDYSFEYTRVVLEFQKLKAINSGSNTLDMIFDKIAKASVDLKKIRSEMNNHKKNSTDYKSYEKQENEVKNHLSNEIKALGNSLNENPDLRKFKEDDINRIVAFVNVEAERVMEGHKPKSATDYISFIKEQAKLNSNKIDRMSVFIAKNKEQIDLLKETGEKLKRQKAACGDNLEKMWELSNKLEILASKRKSFVSRFAQVMRWGLGVFTGAGLVYYGVKAYHKNQISKKTNTEAVKAKYEEKLKNLESMFFTTEEIYIDHAKKLQDVIKKQQKEWSKKDPSINIRDYVKTFKEIQKKSTREESWFFKGTRKKFDEAINKEAERLQRKSLESNASEESLAAGVSAEPAPILTQQRMHPAVHSESFETKEVKESKELSEVEQQNKEKTPSALQFSTAQKQNERESMAAELADGDVKRKPKPQTPSQ